MVNKRIWVALGNSAHINISFHFKISLSSPCSTPWIFNIPELLSILRSKSCCQDCVVDILSSLSTIINTVDTSCIILESCDNLEGDWNRSDIVESFCHLDFITLSDVEASVSAISNWNLWSVDTWISFCYIWVSGISLKPSNMFDILKSMRW